MRNGRKNPLRPNQPISTPSAAAARARFGIGTGVHIGTAHTTDSPSMFAAIGTQATGGVFSVAIPAGAGARLPGAPSPPALPACLHACGLAYFSA
eukprot:6229803-Prymnesium_polylepis.1